MLVFFSVLSQERKSNDNMRIWEEFEERATGDISSKFINIPYMKSLNNKLKKKNTRRPIQTKH